MTEIVFIRQKYYEDKVQGGIEDGGKIKAAADEIP